MERSIQIRRQSVADSKFQVAALASSLAVRICRASLAAASLARFLVDPVPVDTTTLSTAHAVRLTPGGD